MGLTVSPAADDGAAWRPSAASPAPRRSLLPFCWSLCCRFSIRGVLRVWTIPGILRRTSLPDDEREVAVPYTTVGDLTVAYDQQGAGEPVLMINGIGAPRAGWGLQTPTFAKEYTVITYDNRDVGETGPGLSLSPYSMRQFADDAAGLLDVLNIPSAHVVGASMGGCIVQEFAIAHPKKTKSATIICSWARVDPWLAELWDQWEAIFRTQGAAAWSRTTWLWVFTHRAYRGQGFLDGRLTAVAADPRPQTLEMYLRQSHAAKTFDALDRLREVSAPAHVICGAEDIFTPPRYSREIAAAIPGATLSIMPDVGHGMFWEATASFNESVLRFIRQQ
jgi:3-oxoadipate enol-lactonase